MSWTDDFSFYLCPVPEEVVKSCNRESKYALGNHLAVHREGHWPELEGVQVVILGVETAEPNQQRAHLTGADYIRKALYNLFIQHTHISIADIGNIAPGESVNDTYIALQKVVGGMALRNTLVIILGGSQDLSFANYSAYEVLESTVNMAVVDSIIDMGEYREGLSTDNYLSKIVVHKPSYLFNLSVLAYQNFLNDPEIVALMDKLFFDTKRLGELKSDMRTVEPYLRQADIVSIDVHAVARAFAPCSNQPNGLSGEEICQIARYSGLSDNCSSLGIYNFDPSCDVEGQTAKLIAQMVWHAIDGLSSRVKEYPLMSKPDFLEYKVHLADSSDHITFFKSKRTEKWWMNVPYAVGDEMELVRQHLVPCSYSDYTAAASGEFPDLWWRTYRKLT